MSIKYVCIYDYICIYTLYIYTYLISFRTSSISSRGLRCGDGDSTISFHGDYPPSKD